MVHYKNHVGKREDKFYKTTLFQAEHLMIGLNCLEPNQVQKVHDHTDQDKFYYVIEGQERFTVGNEVIDASSGHVIWAEAGVPHGVENCSETQLVILMGIAPAP
ncbi:MAG: cupin domain-containing protein [Anaerolineae bacterium]|nr:cupin domain-containing protein [Anaerolineae bacterium]